jgi:hypothetical protein
VVWDAKKRRANAASSRRYDTSSVPHHRSESLLQHPGPSSDKVERLHLCAELTPVSAYLNSALSAERPPHAILTMEDAKCSANMQQKAAKKAP